MRNRGFEIAKGWEDKNGNIWVPDRAGHGINRQNGDSDHWDVQNKDGTGYINVGADTVPFKNYNIHANHPFL